jgi:hypothetical protein
MEEESTGKQLGSSIVAKGALIEEEDVSMDFMYSNRSLVSATVNQTPGIDEIANKKIARARQSGAMEEEGGILGFENDRKELAGFKEASNQQDDYIEDLIQEKMLKNAGMKKKIDSNEEDDDYVEKKKVQKKKFMISLSDPLSFNGVCKGYMTLWFAWHFKTYKIMHSEEFESVVLSLIPIEDYEGFRNVQNCIGAFLSQIKTMSME